MDKIFNAKWIKSSQDFGEVCPVFFKKFKAESKIKSATLQITGLCVYEAKINGKRISDYVLAPGWTTYTKRLQYQTYDVTSEIKNENIIEVGAGKGWRFHAVPEQTTEHLACDEIAIIATLTIEYENGAEDIIATDGSWSVKKTKTVYSNIYNGESYDANFDCGESLSAAEFPHSNDILIPQEGEEIKEKESFCGGKLIITPKGETVIDFGQEITGYLEIKLKGQKGDEIVIKHFEVLDKDGNVYTENLRKAKQELRFICDGTEHVYKPSYTFFGFRFIQIIGHTDIVKPENFTAIAVYSDMKRIGYFECSDPLLNKLYENIIWGQRGNFLDVPTDCPQRDERLGWTGDAQVFAATAALNYDVLKFFKKWMGDMRAEQFDGGRIPHVIPKITWEGDSSTGWADAACICPWQMYLNYADVDILEDNFDLMKNWVDLIAKRARKEHVDESFTRSMNPYLWNCDGHFGDWLAVGVESEQSPNFTDKALLATAYFAYSTEILIKAGKLLNKDISAYEELYKNIVKAYKEEFMLPDGRSKVKTQTACVLAISFKLTDSVEGTGKQLVEIIKETNCLMTGFLGTPYLLHALDKIGETKLAYDLIFRKEYPSWLYPVTMGATTMWERWNSINPDGSFADVGMNSFNHYAYGAVGDWMYSTMAGINIDENCPGFKNIIFKPVTDNRLSYVRASVDTKYGVVKAEWHKIGDVVEYRFLVPEKCTAIAVLDGKTYNLQAGESIIN